MSWDYFTHARTLELLYHKLQSPVLTRYRMTQIELDVLLFLANHPGLDTAKDIVEIRRLTKSHVSAAGGAVPEGLSAACPPPGQPQADPPCPSPGGRACGG